VKILRGTRKDYLKRSLKLVRQLLLVANTPELLTVPAVVTKLGVLALLALQDNDKKRSASKTSAIGALPRQSALPVPAGCVQPVH